MKKLGNLGKLSEFSGIKATVASVENADKTVEPTTAKPKTKKPKKTEDKPVTINIKIAKSQKEWLSQKASQVRDNNSEPVPPSQRVYPQHLIGVAIDLLQAADLDWGEIKNEQGLREQLNL